MSAPKSGRLAESSASERGHKKGRGPGRPFQPGQSGNPGGTSAAAREAKRLAGEYAVEAMERLVHWMRSDDAKVSLSAALAILDRALGKPATQVPDDADDDDLSQYSDEELRRIVLES